MYKVKLEEEFKHVVQPQRWLIPTVTEVVKKNGEENIRCRDDVSYIW